MSPIQNVHRLNEDTINKIAAGEVIERPASVVKELVENAIDAGATQIIIEIKNGGRQLIRITDNGSGMEREDAVLAIERHTTSKIDEADDLWHLKSLGFRGEALPSIAAVSNFEIITRTSQNELGTQIEVKAGIIQRVKENGAPIGTTVVVRDLFFNTPARFKYLKTIPAETGYITEIVARLALSRPEISFRLQQQDCDLLFSTGKGELLETLVSIFGKENAREMVPIRYEEPPFRITGFIGKPSIARNNRSHEIFFVNGRYFQSRTISSAVEKAYHTLLPIARFPFLVLFLEADPTMVDINAHPTKLEVRFSNDSNVFRIVHHATQQAMKDANLISEWIAPDDLTMRSFSTNRPPATPTSTALSFEYQDYTAPFQAISVQEASASISSDGPASAQTFGVTNGALLAGREFYIFPKAIQNTYIIIQDEKGLLFADQHAVHERILYEKYMRQTREHLGNQPLLIPETVNLSYAQYRVVSDRINIFNDLGYEVEVFGGNTVIIRSVPLSLVNLNCQEILVDLIDQFLSFETFKDPAEIKESFIITMACHAAVKAGEKLDLMEMEALIRDLFACENPYTCPHGRPTVFRITTEELAKKFLRR